MKQFKWLPVSQMVQKKKPEKKRLFNGGGEGDDNSRASLGMDEDSNMSNLSTASDSLDGPPSLSNIGDRWDTSRNFVTLTAVSNSLYFSTVQGARTPGDAIRRQRGQGQQGRRPEEDDGDGGGRHLQGRLLGERRQGGQGGVHLAQRRQVIVMFGA